jgi:predicted 3-demethylubiquinone-9 3-methyltransferase (glyoxalase superfamily)
MNKSIYPCLWFDGNGKEAADLYKKAFPALTITTDTPMVVLLSWNGQQIMMLNGGPMFKPNASISFLVMIDSKSEIEHAWKELTDKGEILMALDRYPWSECYGWVQDRFGVNWQLYLGNTAEVGQRFSPLFTFTGARAGQAEAAITWYTSIFPNSSVMGLARYEKGEGDVEGTIKHGQFRLNDNVFMAMDSSLPHAFDFNEGVSMVVECDTQEEIDHYWNRLTEGGTESMCGWLKDKYGVSWQIIPSVLSKLMSDPSKAERVKQAFLKMKKFDIETLLKA